MTVASVSPNKLTWLLLAYVGAYLLVSWLDVFTTGLALTRPVATEGNVYSTSRGVWDAGRAWTITLVGGLMITGFLVMGAQRADAAPERWLAHPIRSFARLYLNPFAPRNADIAAIHCLAFAFGFVVLRLLAAINNLLIWRTDTGPLGQAIGLLTGPFGPIGAFWLVMGPTFYLTAFACAPLAVRTIGWLKGSSGRSPLPESGAIVDG